MEVFDLRIPHSDLGTESSCLLMIYSSIDFELSLSLCGFVIFRSLINDLQPAASCL